MSKTTLLSSVVLIVAFFIFYILVFGSKGSKLNVDYDTITVEKVKKDEFQDYIAVQGVVEPIRTIFLDAVEGGRVEEKLKEEGSILKKGDPIIRLSNNNLVLEISATEAQVLRTINELRNARNFMQQQLLNSNIEILRLRNEVRQLKRSYTKNQILIDKKHISPEEFQKSEDNFFTSKELLKLQVKYHIQDSIYRSVQVSSLEESVESMTENLTLAQNRLDNLIVRAPVSGELASLNLEVGEVINYGTRVGTINVLDSYKLRVEIDEHYVARVERGLEGECDFADENYRLRIAKMYPEVSNGRFAVDMVFNGKVPEQMKIGQSMRIRLELGESEEVLLIDKGGFYHSTGGQWAYVVDPSGEYAVKREIGIGKQNPRYYEVTGGLEVGEKVIVSGYDSFGDVDRLILKKN